MADLPARVGRWGFPPAVNYDLSLRTFIAKNPALLTAPAVYIPSRVTDWGYWSDPRVALTWTQGLLPGAAPTPTLQLIPSLVISWDVPDSVPFQPWQPLRNITLLAGPPPQLPKNQYSWPLPQAPRPASDLRTFINDLPFHLIGKDKLPVRQQDWPVPREPRPASDLRTFINDLPFQLIGKDKLPVRQQIWPVPIAPDYSVSLRSFLARSLPLLTAAVVAPTFMPGRVSDWGMWERVSFTPADLLAKNIALQPTAVVDRPKNQYSWPLPQSAQRDLSLSTWINAGITSPGAVAVEYIFRAPYYSPQWAGRRFETWTTSVNVPLRAVPPVQPPFNQDDWPLPIAARQPDRTYQRSFPPELVGQDRLPVRQQDWPLTAAPYYDSSLRTQTQRASLAAILTTPIQLPFNQDDWPVPSASRQPDRTWQRAFPPELIGQDRLPIRQQSWPVPIATEFSNALRSIGFRSPALDVVTTRPFVQTDWPVPAAARQPDRTYQRSFPPELIGKDKLPIRQQDWPLPIAPRPAADLRTYIAQSPIRLIGKDRLPIRQQDWPVPRAHLEFHTLRSIMQGRVIYGGEVVPIPPIPPLPPGPVIAHMRAHADAYYGVFFADEIKGRADFSRAKGSNDEEAAN